MAGVIESSAGGHDVNHVRFTPGNTAAHCFMHEAMATRFRLILVEQDSVYAEQAARESFNELDRLENSLSRFVENSDVSRINRLKRGKSTIVTPETFQCLRIAVSVQRLTHGAFDVAFASRQRSVFDQFALNSADSSVRALAQDLRVDLGGIGKGFALDCMAALLRQWDISSGLLWASSSTALAFGQHNGPVGWDLPFGPDADRQSVRLRYGALSASGLRVKGKHIIDPSTGRAACRWKCCWAVAESAAVADALSTAFMVSTTETIRDICNRDEKIAAYVLKTDAERDSVIHIEGRKSRHETT